MIEYIIFAVLIFLCGIITGMYFVSQVEKKIDKHISNTPKKISAVYIEQSPQWFYGLYLYRNGSSGHYKKFSSLDDANAALQTLGCDLTIPRTYSNEGIQMLERIKIDFVKKHGEECTFEHDDIMDVS